MNEQDIINAFILLLISELEGNEPAVARWLMNHYED